MLGQLDGCIIPGTKLRPRFDTNWGGTGACGNTWMDTSNISLPDCVQAPPGYPGLPAQGGWIPPDCGAAPPPEEPPPPPPPPPSGECVNWVKTGHMEEDAGGQPKCFDMFQCSDNPSVEKQEEVPCIPTSPPPTGPTDQPIPSCCKQIEAGGISCEFPAQGFSDYTSDQLTPEVLAMIEAQCAPPPETPPPSPPPTPPPDYYGGGGIPTQPMPLPTGDVFRPAQAMPLPTRGPGQFMTRAFPCGSKPPISVRNLRTETTPSRPDLWQDQWTRI